MRAVGECLERPGLLDALRDVYRDADARIARGGVMCLGGGACCRFDLCSHRLYVSTAELALLTVEAPTRPERSARGRCAYQGGPRCTARQRRPLGCRTFFCRPSSHPDLEGAYEEFHRLIRQLHEQFGVLYVYRELTSALEELSSARVRRRSEMR